MAARRGKYEDVTRTSFGYIYHHLFLPPKLPGADDASHKNETTLLDFVQRSLERFLLGRQDEGAIKAGISILKGLRHSRNPQGHLKDAGVGQILKGLSPQAPAIALQITEQNAGVLITRKPDSVCFEIFELSPTSEAAASTQGRLTRYFPATAVEITLADFKSEVFQSVMSKTLTKMSQQTVRETKPMAKKENPEKEDVIETTNPMIVAELMAGILRGCGKEVAPEKICKNTRDDVIWKDSRVPWRRSSVWLLVRVALQLSMRRISAGDHNTYKEFMAFLMAQVLHAANEQQKIPSDILHIMSNKVSRRLCKLQSPSNGPWLLAIREAISTTSETLQQRWRHISERAEPPLSLHEVSGFKMEDNINFSLKIMDMFLDSIPQRKPVIPEPRFRPTSELNTLSPNQLPAVAGWSEVYLPFKLIEIESWVADNLQTWVDHHMRKAEIPVRELKQLIETYHAKAADYYSGRPEGASRMILTIGELWSAADAAAIQELPLLAEYDPQIPTMLWQALLLGSVEEMKRLQRLESYIRERVKSAEKADRPSILGSFGEPHSFAVEFFGNSTRHQQIKYEIEAEAAAKRQEKREDFRKAKTEYVRLMQKYTESVCDETAKRDWGGVFYFHPSSCRRCGFESKANALGVFVHEWPLPLNDLEAQAVVFEMASPVTFSEWRDLTVYFINNVLLSQPENPSNSQTTYSLKSYQPLKPWQATKPHYRIHLRSEAKPNAIIHRRALPVGQAVESDVCLSSGLIYRYYDDQLNAFSCNLIATDRLTNLCTFKLPERAQVLNRFLRRTWRKPDGETPNEVIAGQSECPDWMPLGEFKALTGMTYGHKIQWMNILTELAMPNINFNGPETATFLLQMSLQAGPESSTITRSTHARLHDKEFGRQMLKNLTSCVLRVQENWESHIALWTYTFLAARLLSLVAGDLSQSFLGLLRQCREISYTWVKTLLGRVEDTSDEVQRGEFSATASNIALICIESFNVDDGQLSQILGDSNQAAILVECSIIVNETVSPKMRDAHIVQDILLDRWRHTMYRARPIMDEQNASGNPFLFDAAERRWRYFKPTSSWALSAGTKCWYQTSMDDLKMYLNILTGELLVNGLPLSRLPADYESHDDYVRIFRGLLHNVMPSMSPGMVFCTTQLLHGYRVHFGKEGQDLFFRLENDRGCFDFIPRRLLAGFLPDSFVEEYAHWHNNKTGVVELYHLSNPLPAGSARWHLVAHEGFWKLGGPDDVFILAPPSGLAQRIANIMAHLEAPLSLHMVYNAKKKLLDVKIPRIQLEFFLEEGKSVIQSRQFRDMHIDEDQSLGTLVGLESKLVLQSDQNPPTRLVLIPEGQLEVKKHGSDMIHDHVIVSVCRGSARRVQAYRIDDLLGRFVANTKLESKLYLAYLHALTSFYLPDPFIGRRGTEVALDILSSSSVRAPTALSPTACNILNLIAALAPSRHYHPDHLRVMQTVAWSPHLSVLTQDDRFFMVTDEIFQRSSEIGFLYPNAETLSTRKVHTTMDLVQRAISRNAGQCVSGFGAEEFCTDNDVIYNSRDNTRSERAARATEMARRAFHDEQGLTQLVSGGLALNLYKLLATGKTASHRGAPPKRDMEYDSLWLQRPSSYLSSYWTQLHHAFHDHPAWLDKVELAVWMATIAYSSEHDEQITQALLMMALSPSVAAAPLPLNETHDLGKGYAVQPDMLEAAAAPHMTKHRHGPEGKSRSRTAKGDGKAADRLHREYGKDKKQAINIFRDRLARQWPCQVPKQPSDYHMEAYIDVPRAMKSVLPSWRTWWANKNFKEYLEGFVAALKDVPLRMVTVDEPPMGSELPSQSHRKRFVSVGDIFSHDAPDIKDIPPVTLQSLVTETRTETEESKELAVVLDLLESRARLQFERNYLSELRESLSSLKNHSHNSLAQDDALAALFQEHLAHCKPRYEQIYSALCDAVQPFSKSEPRSAEHLVHAIISEAGLQPRISPVFFLQQLKHSSWSKLSGAWKESIIEYALAVTALQKAKRLVQFQNDPVELLRELENKGHDGWNPRDHPEWLLIECESQIMIRQVQQQIARNMIQPPDDHNAVMQLNMGEGKSSVIVPIVSTALGDGSRLVRVIVAKPQAKQMYQMLVTKLSGLVNRPIYQLPFSRDVRINAGRSMVIYKLLVKCQKEGGVLLVQPEHLLSFQLMELELELGGQSLLAEEMRKTRLFFENHSRDVVDESDENFDVKFELIYTLGQQRPIDHSPDRWAIVQEVLGLLHRFAAGVKKEFPQSIDLDERHREKFPMIRILRRDAEKAIFNRVADFICETGITGLPIARQPPHIRNAVRRYITEWELSPEEVQAVEDTRFWDGDIINHILILRGLLCGGALGFALRQKRWRVNYGLDLTRKKKTKLAVPYKAKDSPTPRSEFSHPDIVIILTCLSYYYGGLGDQALFDCLELLIRSDKADSEYQSWAQASPTLPEAFRHLQGVNIKDRIQCVSTIFPHIRYSKAAIDYYLHHMVFIQECREFPHKLSASGWDLGKKKQNATTGFSGTNDSRYILPLDIRQLDLPEQKHTNALVLKNLLRPENSIALMREEMVGATFCSQSLLEIVTSMSSRPRVILDVGAQVIDLTNLGLARAWLGHYASVENTQAVIFFNDFDELVVLDKSGKVEELQTSPFADQLDQCLVFLDEAHTRGIDLRLPTDYQAAVTLGSHLTKDRLTQACMRMRKLGKGQSVVFFVPREIEQKICLLRGQEHSPSANITVSDVLCWAMMETCADLRRAEPLWLSQGIRFAQQQTLWNKLTTQTESINRLECAKGFLEDEAQSLERRYRPRRANRDITSLLSGMEPQAAAVFKSRCEEFDLGELGDSSFNEEQERELSPEIEQERQVKKPLQAMPAAHQIHPGLKEFILNGIYPKDAFQPAFMSLQTTSAAQHFDVSEFSKNLLVTRDFAKTVKGPVESSAYLDSFHRPVQWILSAHRNPNILVIVSPYEVQHLLSAIEQSHHIMLHLYSPRVNLGYESLDSLDFYNLPKVTGSRKVPRYIISLLCQFSGQLYLSSFNDYVQLCESLGLAWKSADDYVTLGPDGFIPPDSTGGDMVNKSGFSKSPVKFLKILMTNIRQDAGHLEKTHMGRILEGVRLLESDFAA